MPPIYLLYLFNSSVFSFCASPYKPTNLCPTWWLHKGFCCFMCYFVLLHTSVKHLDQVKNIHLRPMLFSHCAFSYIWISYLEVCTFWNISFAFKIQNWPGNYFSANLPVYEPVCFFLGNMAESAHASPYLVDTQIFFPRKMWISFSISPAASLPGQLSSTCCVYVHAVRIRCLQHPGWARNIIAMWKNPQTFCHLQCAKCLSLLLWCIALIQENWITPPFCLSCSFLWSYLTSAGKGFYIVKGRTWHSHIRLAGNF